MFFLAFISLFSLIVYLVMVNTNNKRKFIIYIKTCLHGLTRVSNQGC